MTMMTRANLYGFEWLRHVSATTIRSDLIAGLTGAALVLPQAVAFSAIAGLPPEYGLYTAMVPTVIAAVFGASLIMVSGPATAISALVFGALGGEFTAGSPEYIAAAIMLSVMVGAIQILFYFARVGRLAGFVSHSVMIGFTAAAALLIAVSQIGPALGLAGGTAHGIVGRVIEVVTRLGDASGPASMIAGITLTTAIIFRTFLPRWPGFLIAIGVGTALAQAMGSASEGLRYVGALPAALPGVSMPALDLARVSSLWQSAFAIAMVGLLEAIAIGRSLAHRTRSDFSANRETMGQGLSNLVGGFLQCYPSSGSFTRSSVNVEAGAKTPVAAVASAGFLVVLVLIFRPLVELVPIAAVAGLILYVAWLLLDLREMAHLIRTSRTESLIVMLTLLAGVFISLEFAVYVGTFASLAVFLGKSANPELAIGAPKTNGIGRKIANAEVFDLPECPATIILRLDGPLFFGSVDALTVKFRKLERERPIQTNMILVLHGVGNVDLAGVELLAAEAARRRAAGGALFVVIHYPPLAQRLRKLGLMRLLGEEFIFDSKRSAIAAAVANTREEICAVCSARVFLECATRPGAVTASDQVANPPAS
jgi:SulP family sulfate permease